MRGGRVLFLITDLSFGGAETQAVQLATRLKARGWELRLVSLLPPKAYVEELSALGIPVISLGIRRKIPDPRPLLKLARIIRAWRPHVIHSHMVHANIVARFLRPMTKVPILICTAHSISEKGRKGSGWLRELLYRLTDGFCDLTTQVSQAGLERYVLVGAVPCYKIRYIPNGVDTERFHPDPEVREKLRKDLGLEGAFIWLAVGRFTPQKDYSSLLQAFARVVVKRPEARLLIAGDGPLRPAMEKLVKEFGVSSQTKFLGVRRDIPELMNAADAYVMSSTYEGMPMVLLEAHATGLPIVATDVGGNREIIVNGKTGLLIPPRNPEALGQAMLHLMNLSEERRREMGRAGREHILANFSLERVVGMWESLYQELLAKKGINLV